MSASPLGYSLSPEILAAMQDPTNISRMKTPTTNSEGYSFDNTTPLSIGGRTFNPTYLNSQDGTPGTFNGYTESLGDNTFAGYDPTGVFTGSYKGANTWNDFATAAAMALPVIGEAGGLGALFSSGSDAGGGGGILDSLLGEGGGAGGDALAEGFGQGVSGTQAGASLTGATGSGTLPSFAQSLPQFTAPAGASGIGSSILSGLKDISPYAPLISSVGDYFLKQNMGNKQMGQFQQTQNNINGLYAPGSPEYNYLDQKLQREAAASGRNSQSGQLATNLAATIAQIKANALGQTLGNQNQQFNTALGNQSSGLNSLFFNLMKHYGE